MKKIFIALVLGLLIGCTSNKEIKNDINVLTVSGIERDLVDTAYFKNSQWIPLETNDNSLLRRIDRISNHDNKLFVFDKSLNKIVVFDMEGKYLADIHRVGQGNSEYISIEDFCLDTVRKQIFVLCDRPYKIMRFNYSGDFIGEKAVKDLYLNIITDSDYVYCNKSELSTGNQDNYELVCMDLDFNVIGNQLDLRKGITNNAFLPGSEMTTTLNNYYTRRFDNAIYQLVDGKVIKKYEIDFKENTLPENLLKNETEENFNKVIRERKYVYSITDVVENKNFLSFKTNVAIFVLDKQKNSLDGFSTIQYSKTRTSWNSYFSVGNNSQMIASVVEPILLFRMKEYANPEQLKLMEEMKEDDNPILILYEFK